jgi:hypothetical protein
MSDDVDVDESLEAGEDPAVGPGGVAVEGERIEGRFG